MTRLNQRIQGDPYFEHNVFHCYCGDDSWFQISRDVEDNQFYFTITRHPTRLKERLRWAWKAFRGLEFTAVNEVIIDGDDIPSVIEALQAGIKKTE